MNPIDRMETMAYDFWTQLIKSGLVLDARVVTRASTNLIPRSSCISYTQTNAILVR